MTNPDPIVLKYVGDGAYVVGVPACDLTQAMIDECGVPMELLLIFTDGVKPIYVTEGQVTA